MKEFPKYKLYTSMFDILMWTYVYIHRLTSWKIILYDRVVWTQAGDPLLCMTRAELNLKASQRYPSPKIIKYDRVECTHVLMNWYTKKSGSPAWPHVTQVLMHWCTYICFF